MLIVDRTGNDTTNFVIYSLQLQIYVCM